MSRKAGMARARTNPALRDFWLTPARIRVLYGGRSASKTWDVCARAVYLADRYRCRFLCVRRFQNKLENSVYPTIRRQAERFGIAKNFEFQRNKIIARRTGSDFSFYGLDRNPEEIKGFEGADVLYLEEAECISKEQWDILVPTIRTEGSEIWVVFNPRFDTDFAYRHFVADPPENALVRKINYDENPFNSRTMLDQIESDKRIDPETYRHKYLGEPWTDDEATVIRRRWLESCVNARAKLGIHHKPVNRRIGFDVADEGEDNNATVSFAGLHCDGAAEWRGGEDGLPDSCRRVWHQARSERASIDYDSIGVGALAGGMFRDLNAENGANVVYRKFVASGEVHEPKREYQPGVRNGEHFENLKSQAWQRVADLARDTHAMVEGAEPVDPERVLSFAPDLPGLSKLLTELSTPKRRYSRRGRVMVESKEELAKRGSRRTIWRTRA